MRIAGWLLLAVVVCGAALSCTSDDGGASGETQSVFRNLGKRAASDVGGERGGGRGAPGK